MKICYTFAYPWSLDIGGGSRIIKDIVDRLSNKNDTKELKMIDYQIDFDVLIYFGSTYFSPDVLELYRKKGVKVVVYPIFDRMRPLWQMKLFKFMLKFPVLNAYSLRSAIVSAGDLVIVANESEKRDLIEIYNIDSNKIEVLHYGINDKIIELDKKVGTELFLKKYGWKDFVFYPSATISKRKNQISLLKALKDTDLKIVLNNTQSIESDIEEEFKSLTENNKNVLCLEKLSLEELVSCYKCAKVSVSLSQAETAGLVNLEASFLGCNVVVSDLESLREYVGEIAYFVDQNNIQDIRQKILDSYNKPYNQDNKNFILKKYSWDGYAKKLIELIKKY
jgi:glycosyltransferase involved in cell wall biosynthesis